MKKVIVTGGTGFIGQPLVLKLQELGYDVFVISHEKRRGTNLVLDLAQKEPPSDIFEGAEAVIHLAGVNIFRRWDSKIKKAIYESRIASTRHVVEAIKKTNHQPKVLITASASGFYGDTGQNAVSESSQPGNDWLARLCVDWERESRKVEDLGLRSVQVRTSPVLGRGGMLAVLVPFYQSYLGLKFGNGQQWFSWISHQDIVAIYIFCLKHHEIHGPVNGCSPIPVSFDSFVETLGHELNRPAYLRLPAWFLHLVLDGMAEMVIQNQRITPQKLLELGYKFDALELKTALRHSL